MEEPIDTSVTLKSSGPPPLSADQNPALRYPTGSELAPEEHNKSHSIALPGLLTSGRETAVDMSWHLLTAERTQALRSELSRRYAPTTANGMLAALRGVLKEAWASASWTRTPTIGRVRCKAFLVPTTTRACPFRGGNPRALRGVCAGSHAGRRARCGNADGPLRRRTLARRSRRARFR